MVIGYLYIEFYIPWSHSLKEKRKFINSFKNRVRNHYNVAVAEVDFQSLWQRVALGLVSIASERAALESTFERILKDASFLDAQILKQEVEYL